MLHFKDSDQVLCLQMNEYTSIFMLNTKLWGAHYAINL